MLKSVLAPALVASLLATVGASDTRAQALPGAAFESILDNAVQAGAPGVVLHVETWDGQVWSGAAGATETEDPEPMTPDMPFRLFDMSKMAVAALALTLVDDAELGLDDRIGKWIDPALIQDIPYSDRITIRDLVAQTSGIRDYFDEDFIFATRADPGRVWQPAQLIAHAAKGDPFAAPGRTTAYDSNTNTVLLGLAIEKAGGAALAAQLRERIFEPLGMTATHSWEAGEGSPSVHGYVPQLMYRIDVSDIDLSLAWGAGGMISTAKDVAALTRGLFEGDVLSSAGRALMTESFLPLADGETEYGHGTMRFIALDPAPIGHSGEGVGFGTVAAWWPESGLVVVVLTNLEAPTYFGVLTAVAALVGEQ